MINKQSIFQCVQRLALISLIVLCTVPTYAQRRGGYYGASAGDNYHFGYISGTVGYSMLQTNLSSVLPRGNFGGAVGAGYEFRNSGFWASVGVQLSFHRSSLIIDEYVYDHRGLDTQGRSTTFHYRVNQVDEVNWNFFDVPIIFGYYVKGFHIGGGLKVSYALNPQTYTKGMYNLSATNDNLSVTFENMPDRGYTDYRFGYTHENRLNVGVSGIGEIGYDVLSKARVRSSMCHVMRFSFYFEYGLNNYLKNWDAAEQRVVPDDYGDAPKATIYPYLNTFTNPARTVPFYTGLKITYMIGGTPGKTSTSREGGCMCYQNN